MVSSPALLALVLLGCPSGPEGTGSVVDPQDEPAPSTDSEGDDTAGDSGEERRDMDGDGYVEGDCGETDPAVHPGAVEVCNGVDDDCEGTIDQGAADAPTWFLDADADVYGDDTISVTSCAKPSGYTFFSGDCDDSDPAVNPVAKEWCDGIDDNCSGNEDDAEDAEAGFEDGDGDGFGFAPRRTCAPGPDFVHVDGDCADGDPTRFPGSVEWCNVLDDDCDGETDEEARDSLAWYADGDGDTFGDAARTTYACTAPAGHVADDTDCDDADAGVGGPLAWFADGDGDGYGDAATWACVSPAGAVTLGGDCDDAEPTIYPGAPEACDASSDLDCDGLFGTDDGDGDALRACEDCDDADATVAGPELWYADRDGDGYGDATQSMAACSAATGFVLDATDCNDASAVAHPGAPEVWYDDEDEDCLGGDDWDADLDGFAADVDDCLDSNATVHPGAPEVCANHLDDDCDGTDGGCADVGSMSLAGADAVIPSADYAAQLGGAWAASPDGLGVGDSVFAVGARGRDFGSGVVYVGSTADFLRDSASPSWRAEWTGEFPGDNAGAVLSDAGDMDGDSVPDVAVAAYYHGAGAVYLIPLDVSGVQSLGTAPQRLDGVSGNVRFGGGLVQVDDLDDNGADELIVADPYHTGAGGTYRGCVFYFEGPLPASTAAYTGRLCGDMDYRKWGGDEATAVVDLLGDGAPELAVISGNATGNALYAGKMAFLELPFSGTLEVDAADFYLYGTSADAALEQGGGTGDINDDGYEDLYTGHSSDSTYAYQAGAVHVYFGPLSAGRSDDDANLVIYGTRESEYAAIARAAGDVDADGSADLLVQGASEVMPSVVGRVGLFHGPLSGTTTLDDADLLLVGEEAGDAAGNLIHCPGDLDADGFDDLLIGASGWGGGNEGRAYIWLGTGG